MRAEAEDSSATSKKCNKAAPNGSTSTDEIARGFIGIKKEPEKYTCSSVTIMAVRHITSGD
jgi:hypothetical protein